MLRTELIRFREINMEKSNYIDERLSDKSRTAALLLALFLGGFGAHRFYAGKPGTAIIMLILTLTVVGAIVSGIWAFVDFIMILAGGFKDREEATIKNW